MVNVYFNNIEDIIISNIKEANVRIYVAVSWFTNGKIFKQLLESSNRKVDVRVLILDDLLNRNEYGLDFGHLSIQGAEVRLTVPRDGTMHHKFCIIDDKIISGSYNWTYHANKNNENILLSDEPEVVRDYCNEFDNLFNNGSPIKLPYEHLKWTSIKEGDFSELRRNIFRDIIAKNDENRELKRIKLIHLDRAYHKNNADELRCASSLPIAGHFKTISEVLTSREHEFDFKLWEENRIGKAYESMGHSSWGKWYYIPYGIKEDKYHREYVDGALKYYNSLNFGRYSGLDLHVFDESFVQTMKMFWIDKTNDLFGQTPKNLLLIEHAKLCFYQFPSPVYNKSQAKEWRNKEPRSIPGINLYSIAKEVNSDNIVFYDGWNPQKRGEKIMKEFFVKTL